MIFGSGSAKFTYSGSTVLLEYSNLRPNWCQRSYTDNESIYDHYKTIVFEGDYNDFWVDVNLHQYVGPSSPSIKFDEIYPYLFQYVVFYPHSDSAAISGSGNTPAIFFIDDMKHSYYTEDYVAKDMLSIHFKSISYTNISGSLI